MWKRKLNKILIEWLEVNLVAHAYIVYMQNEDDNWNVVFYLFDFSHSFSHIYSPSNQRI